MGVQSSVLVNRKKTTTISCMGSSLSWNCTAGQNGFRPAPSKREPGVSGEADSHLCPSRIKRNLSFIYCIFIWYSTWLLNIPPHHIIDHHSMSHSAIQLVRGLDVFLRFLPSSQHQGTQRTCRKSDLLRHHRSHLVSQSCKCSHVQIPKQTDIIGNCLNSACKMKL